MSHTLYRKEALESRIKGFSNPVSIRGSLSATLLTACLLGILVGLIAYAWLTSYTRKVTAPGFIEPSSGGITLSAPVAGVLELRVANGARVEKGELLAVISDTFDVDRRESLISLQLEGLEARRQLVDERIALTERRLTSAERIHSVRIANAERQQHTRERILEMQRREHELAVASRDRVAALFERKLDTQSSLDEADSTLIAASQRLIDAETAALEAAERVQTSRIDRELELNEINAQLVDYRSEGLSLSNQIERLSAEQRRDIVAPIDGVVTVSKARDLQRVSLAEPLFRIDPAGDHFQATVLAPSAAIGFVAEGDLISIRYAAYPYREHGVFRGLVRAIDNTAQLPQAIAAPIAGDEPVYRIYTDIDQAPVNKRGERLRLASGMLFEASIIADQKPILFWLLDPVL